MLRSNNKKGGRPGKKTAALVDKLVELISKGNYFSTSARASGVSYSTFCRWMKEDKEFRNKIKKAEAEGEAKCVAGIELASLDHRNWTAIAWRLERRWPKRWAKKQEFDFGGGGRDKSEKPIATVIPPGCSLDVALSDDE